MSVPSSPDVFFLSYLRTVTFYCLVFFFRSLLPALSCVQTALLHLLDMSWEPNDLSFFVEIQLPHLLMATSQENISIHDSVIW